MLCPQSLDRAITEVITISEHNIYLMPLDILHANPQSSDRLTLSTFAAWQISYLQLSQNTREYSLTIWVAMLAPKWSTCPCKTSASCFNNTLRCHCCNLRQFLHKAECLPWLPYHLLHWDIRKCLSCNLWSAQPPKWSRLPGSMFTSCFSPFQIPFGNLQTCFHPMLSQPGKKSIFPS